MNTTLKLIESNGQYLAGSREIAELIRTIKRYIDTITTNPNLGALDFFITSTQSPYCKSLHNFEE